MVPKFSGASERARRQLTEKGRARVQQSLKLKMEDEVKDPGLTYWRDESHQAI